MTSSIESFGTGGIAKDSVARYQLTASLIQERHPAPADLIELGGAPGDQIAGLAKLGYRTTAVDIGIASDAWAGATEGRMTALLEAAGTSLVEWNLEETPYPLPDESWDVAVMTEVYEHLRDYPFRSLQECFRILRPGGHLIFTTPNAAYVMNRLRLLRGHSTATSLRAWIDGYPHFRHAREYTFAEAHELMELAGFEVDVSMSRHFYVDSGRTDATSQLIKRGLDELSRRRKTLGPAIVLVARKPAR